MLYFLCVWFASDDFKLFFSSTSHQNESCCLTVASLDTEQAPWTWSGQNLNAHYLIFHIFDFFSTFNQFSSVFRFSAHMTYFCKVQPSSSSNWPQLSIILNHISLLESSAVQWLKHNLFFSKSITNLNFLFSLLHLRNILFSKHLELANWLIWCVWSAFTFSWQEPL